MKKCKGNLVKKGKKNKSLDLKVDYVSITNIYWTFFINQ